MKLWRFTLWFIVMNLLFSLIIFGLRYLSIGMPPGLTTIVPTIIVAMNEGQLSARQTKAELSPARAWRDAVLMTGAVAALTLGLVYLSGLRDLFVTPLSSVESILVASILIIVFFANRVFLMIGHRLELKRIRLREEADLR